jgi:hypothetical protein
MAKFLIDIIIEAKDIGIRDIFNYENYESRGFIKYKDDNELQVCNDPRNGYCNIETRNFSEYYMFENMYSKQCVSQLKNLSKNSNSFSFLFSGKFGFNFIDDVLNYVYFKYPNTQSYILDDQSSELMAFSLFLKLHIKKKFFWINH